MIVAPVARDGPGAALWRLLLAAALLFIVPAAARAQYRPGVPVATLFRAGPYVFINERQAGNGMTIFSGDRVRTGPVSSALIRFYAGGSIQLDANTDPDIFGRFAGYVGCWVRVLVGQTYSDGEGQTICFGSGAEEILSQSAFNLQVRPGGEVLSVTAGAVTVAGVRRQTVLPGMQASIAGGRIVSQRYVSREEMERIIAWRYRYAFAAPGLEPPSPPPRWPFPPPRRDHFPRPHPRPPHRGEPGGRDHGDRHPKGGEQRGQGGGEYFPGGSPPPPHTPSAPLR